MKQFPALIAAFLITAVIGAGMFVVGGSALANKNTVTTYNSPSSAVAASNVSNVTASNVSSSQAQAQITQLEGLINQYKAREQQYQAQINQAEQQLSQYNDQLSQANQEVQQFQSLLAELQSRGVIQITSDGRILIPQGGFGDSR